MNAAEHENDSRNAPGKEDPSSPANDASPEASFARLLQQLEAESEKPSLNAGISQIFSTVQTPPAPPEATRPIALASADAQAFAPSSRAESPFAGAAFDPRPFVPVAPVPHARDTSLPPPPAPVQASHLEQTAALPHVPPAHAATPPAVESATPAALGSSSSSAALFADQLPLPVPAPATPSPEQAGEFTRIFTQLPTPRSAPPAILAEVAASAPVPDSPQPGEFTQFFRALDPSTTSPPPSPAPSAPPPNTVNSAPPPPHQAPQPAALQPAPADQPLMPQAFAPRDFTPAPAAPQRETSHVTEPAQPGAFTAFFQTPAPREPEAPALRAAAPPALPAAFSEPPRSQPATGGGFTELLQSLTGDSSAAPGPNRTPPPAFASSPNFSSDSDFGPAVTSPAPQSARTPLPSNAFAPQASTSQRQPPSGQPRPGEFTELMQSLQQPAAKPSTPPESQTPFFGGTPISSGAPSEFTRIMQSSAARSAEAPIPAFAPAPQASGAAVGLPIAAPQLPKPAAPALPVAEAKTALQKMMPWLLAANGALLLLLVALAFIFLRHRH